MENKYLQKAYEDAVAKGYRYSIDDFYTLISTNEEYLNRSYEDAVSGGYKYTVEDFSELVGVKKKAEPDQSQDPGQQVLSQQKGTTGSTSDYTYPMFGLYPETTSSDSEDGTQLNKYQTQLLDSLDRDQAKSLGYLDEEWSQSVVQSLNNKPEEDDRMFMSKWAEKSFGSDNWASSTIDVLDKNVFRPTWWPEWARNASPWAIVDETIEAFARGQSSSDQVSEGFNLMDEVVFGDGSFTEEDANRFLNAKQDLIDFVSAYGEDDDVNSFLDKFDENLANGLNTFSAWGSAIYQHPQSFMNMFAESLGKMTTKTPLVTGAGVMGGSIGISTGIGAFAGPIGAGVGAIEGTIAGIGPAFVSMGATMELGLSMFGAVDNYLYQNGLPETPENVLTVLNDKELLLEYAENAQLRAAIIAAMDFVTFKASSAVAKPIVASSPSFGAPMAVLATQPIETIGEGLGEAFATASVSDKGFVGSFTSGEAAKEGFIEATGSLAGGAKSVLSETIKARAESQKAKFLVNGTAVSREAVSTIINTSDKEKLTALDITIYNDKELSEALALRLDAFDIAENIDGEITGVDRNELVQLNVELKSINEALNASQSKDQDKTRQERRTAIQNRIAEINDKYINVAEEVVEAPVEKAEASGVFVEEAINRRAVLNEYGGKEVNEEGTVYLDGETVVLETENRIYELGNVDEVSDMDMSELGLSPVQEEVSVNQDGTLRVDDKNWGVQTELDNKGIEYDNDGNVSRVSLKDSEGNTAMYDGQKAVDIAYQIILSEIQTPEQQQRVNEQLEKDEEFKEQSRLYAEQRQRDEQSGEVKATSQKPADKNTEQTTKKRVKRPEGKPKSQPKTKRKVERKEYVQKRMQNIYERLSVAVTDKEKHRLVSEFDQLLSTDAEPTKAQLVMYEETKKQLIDKGHKEAKNIKEGEQWSNETVGNPKLIPDPTLNEGDNIIGRVLSPRILDKNGNVINEGDYVVRVGTRTVKGTTINGKQVGSKAVNLSGLQDIMSAVFGIQGKRASATAKIGDRLIGSMAKRAGVTKEEMYDAISFVKANSIDESNNNPRYQAAVNKLKEGISKQSINRSEMFQAMMDEGRLTIGDRKISDFVGPVVLHAPDNMFAGSVTIPGVGSIEGNGGLYYPIVFGSMNYFWAGTKGTVATTVNQLNSAAKRSKNGKVRMALTLSPSDKLLSNTTASRGVMDIIFSAAINKNLPLNKNDLKAVLYNAGKKFGADVKKGQTSEEMRDIISEKLNSYNSSFEERKTFSIDLLGETAKVVAGKKGVGAAKRNKAFVEYMANAAGISEDVVKNMTRKNSIASKSGLITAVSNIFQDEFFYDVNDTGVLYAFIEVDVNPNGDTFVSIDTEKEGLPTHESFPFAIVPSDPNNKVSVHVVSDPKKYYNVVAPTGTHVPLGKDSKRAFPTNAGLSLSPLDVVSVEREAAINEYLTQISNAKDSDPTGYWSVSMPTREELEGAFIIETEAGFGYVTPDGDIKGVFKKPSYKGKGAAVNILESLIKGGGFKLDNFDGYLTKIYERAGFKVAARTPFNTKYSPEGWNEESHGKPDVVAMVYDPDNKLDIQEKSFESYDEAIAYRDSFMEERNSKYEGVRQQFYQDQRAGLVLEGAQKIVYALNNPDVSSPMHEFAHVYEDYLEESEKSAILQWVGHETWSMDTSEAFAQGFEKYLSEGVSPTPDLKGIFENFKKWMLEVYNSIKNSPLELELNDDMRDIYDAMLNESNPDNMTINGRGKRTFYQDSKTGRFKSSLHQTMVAIRKKWVDTYAGIIDIQNSIKKEGGEMYDWMDFDMAIALMSTKQANDVSNILVHLEDLKNVMRKENINVDDLNDYMIALHAKERNAFIFDKFEKENGSGKTDEWADETINRLEDRIPSLNKAASILQTVMENTRKDMVKFGLESSQTIDFWKSNYQNYVPLYGFALDEEMSVDEDGSEKNRYPTGGSGINVSGRTVKEASGRTTESANVIGNIFQQAQAVAMKGRKNEALQTLMNLFVKNPSMDYSVGEKKNGANSVGVRVNGKQVYITFKKLEHAQTLRGETVANISKLQQWANKIVNVPWLRRSLTSLNPFFGPVNFIRDFGLGMINAISEAQIVNGQVVGADVSKRIPMNLVNSFSTIITRNNLLSKHADEKWSAYYDEFLEDGGKVGWGKILTSEEITSQVEKETSRSSLSQKSSVVLSITKKGTIDAIEAWNDMFENSFRFSSYVSARQAGVSRGKAAQFSKNVTVNFNKYGDMGPLFNASFLFFNPAVQSVDRLIRTFFTPVARTVNGKQIPTLDRIHKPRVIAASLTTTVAMITMYNIASSDEDDDGILFYNKISEDDKMRNIIIMKPNGKDYWKIPIQYGLNLFSSMGEVMGSIYMNERDLNGASSFMLKSAVNSFVPISVADSDDLSYTVISAASPDAAQPFIDMTYNQTYFGSSVTSRESPWGSQSASSRAKRSPEWSQKMFKAINEMTGGSEYVSGWLDVNPDYLYYYLEYIGGSFVREPKKILDRAYNAAVSDEEPKYDIYQYPMRRKFEGEPSKFYDSNLYYRNNEEIESLYEEYMDLKEKKRGDDERYSGVALLHEYNQKYVLVMMENIRRKINKAKEIKDPVARHNKIYDLYEEQRQVYMKYNMLYRNKRGSKNE